MNQEDKDFNSSYYKKEKLVPTTDDWFPTDDGLVKLSSMPLRPWRDNPKMYRVCIWGGDDFGLEKDYLTQEEADRTYEMICNCTDVTIDLAYSLGFIPC